MYRRREGEQSVWVEVKGSWELNRRREAEASVWVGAETSLGFDRRRQSSKSDDGKQKRQRQAKVTQAKVTMASKSDDEQANKTANRFGGDSKQKQKR